MELIDVSKWEDDIFSDYGGYTRKIGKIDENGNRWMVKFEKKHSFKSSPLNLFEQHINFRNSSSVRIFCTGNFSRDVRRLSCIML